MQYIEKQHPWVGKVVLTPHASPALTVPNRMVLPAGMTYLEPNMGQVRALDTLHENPTTEPAAKQSREEVMNVIVYGVVITLVTSKTAEA